MAKECADKDKYHPSNGVLEPRVQMPRAKVSVRTVRAWGVSYGPPWAHYLDGYQDRLLGGPLGLPGLCYTAPDGVEHKDYGGVLG
jgi:hypothetical protein